MASIIKSYDEGLRALLYTRFKTILGIDDMAWKFGIIMCPEDLALREMAERRGDTWLDFISFYRSAQAPSWGRQRTVLAQRGVWLDADTRVTAQPVDLSYFVTFWSKDLDILNQLIEKYILWQHDYPKILLSYGSFTIDPDLHFGDIIDQSTYSQKYETGIIYAFRMPIKIDGWILESETVSGEIETIRLTVYDKGEVTDYSSITVEDSAQDTELEEALRFFRRKYFEISAVSSVDNSITVLGDRVSDIDVGDTIIVQGSTDSNGMYTVLSRTLLGVDTVIVISEFVIETGVVAGTIGTVADGVVYKDE